MRQAWARGGCRVLVALSVLASCLIGTVVARAATSDRPAVTVPDGDVAVIAGGGSTAPTSGEVNATDAQLGGAGPVAVDSSGNVYFADPGNDSIEKITPHGELSIVAGCLSISNCATPSADGPTSATASSLGTPTALAVDSSGNLYIADSDHAIVDKVTGGSLSVIAGGGLTTPSTTPIDADTAELNYPTGLAVDSSGNVYITDARGDQQGFNYGLVEKVTPGGELSVIAGHVVPCTTCALPAPTPTSAVSTAIGMPTAIAVDDAGNVFVSVGGIIKVTPEGELSEAWPAGPGDGDGDGDGPSESPNLPEWLAFDSLGNLYATDTTSLGETYPDGEGRQIVGYMGSEPTTSPMPAADVGIDNAEGVAVDAAGNVYLSDVGIDDGSPQILEFGESSQPVAPVFTAYSPPKVATVDASYEYTFAATGAPTPAFAVSSGSLPPGMLLNRTTGVLSGTPTTLGAFTFTITAGNGVDPDAVTPNLTITVRKGTCTSASPSRYISQVTSQSVPDVVDFRASLQWCLVGEDVVLSSRTLDSQDLSLTRLGVTTNHLLSQFDTQLNAHSTDSHIAISGATATFAGNKFVLDTDSAGALSDVVTEKWGKIVYKRVAEILEKDDRKALIHFINEQIESVALGIQSTVSKINDHLHLPTSVELWFREKVEDKLADQLNEILVDKAASLSRDIADRLIALKSKLDDSDLHRAVDEAFDTIDKLIVLTLWAPDVSVTVKSPRDVTATETGRRIIPVSKVTITRSGPFGSPNAARQPGAWLFP